VVTLMLASTGETVYCNTFWLAVAHTSESPGLDSVTVGFALTVMVASASLLSWQLPSPWEALSLSVNGPGVQPEVLVAVGRIPLVTPMLHLRTAATYCIVSYILFHVPTQLPCLLGCV
jgi:hypothetical protein